MRVAQPVGPGLEPSTRANQPMLCSTGAALLRCCSWQPPDESSPPCSTAPTSDSHSAVPTVMQEEPSLWAAEFSIFTHGHPPYQGVRFHPAAAAAAAAIQRKQVGRCRRAQNQAPAYNLVAALLVLVLVQQFARSNESRWLAACSVAGYCCASPGVPKAQQATGAGCSPVCTALEQCARSNVAHVRQRRIDLLLRLS
jgi:hypothetical protein